MGEIQIYRTVEELVLCLSTFTAGVVTAEWQLIRHKNQGGKERALSPLYQGSGSVLVLISISPSGIRIFSCKYLKKR